MEVIAFPSYLCRTRFTRLARDDESWFHDLVTSISHSAVEPDTPGKVSLGWLIGISSFWFATSFKWFLILVFLLPDHVAKIVPGGEKGAYWGAVFGIGAIWAVVGPALFGDLSDRTGDRRPFVVGGSLLTILSLFVLFYANAIWMLTIGYLLLQISDDLATGPYSAVIPERVPEKSRGAASGIMGAAMSISQVVAVIAVLATSGAKVSLYIAIGVLNISSALFAARLLVPTGVRQTQSTSVLKSWAKPWKHADFRWVWLTRFLATLGFYLVIPYANFYIRDIVTNPILFGHRFNSPDSATAVLALVMALSGASGSVISGPLIDRIGRKTLAYIGSAIMAGGLFVLIVLPQMLLLSTIAIFIGLGYGIFQTANWAMVTDVLPEKEGLGRDMGIWQMSISSVQIFAGGAGFLLAQGNKVHIGLGYQILFVLAGIMVTLSGFVSRLVRGSR